jgi:large exoprotein involved in heme utilization and adhesion
LVAGGSQILATTVGSKPGGSLVVAASESVKLIGPGNPLNTRTIGSGDAGDITITTRNLSIQNGVQVFTFSSGAGSGGQLTVNASDSVEFTVSPLGALLTDCLVQLLVLALLAT